MSRRIILALMFGGLVCAGLWRCEAAQVTIATHSQAERSARATAENARAVRVPRDNLLSSQSSRQDGHDNATHDGKHASLDWPLYAVIPFVLLLLFIALMPLINHRWWDSHRHKLYVVIFMSTPIAIMLAFEGEAGWQRLVHALQEYGSFICLIGSLYVIAGNIHIRLNVRGTPMVNALIMMSGALMANLVGTTGASMLLIRPVLYVNRDRWHVVHIPIFFILIVSNCGGLLTPLGDPPLFLGFIKGVPFTWTLRLLPHWLCMIGYLLGVFYIWDWLALRNDRREVLPAADTNHSQLMIVDHAPRLIVCKGGWNVLGLLSIVGVIVLSGQGWGNHGQPWAWGVAEICMLMIAATCQFLTAPQIRKANGMSWNPILEVVILFAGIFITMIPALEILNQHAPNLGLSRPRQFFWVTGALSSLLDNAPSYLSLAAAACGILSVPLTDRYLDAFLHHSSSPELAQSLLAAISCGAVFMGANTYIGNGPNFMVMAIAQENNIKMPHFFGYMTYSLLIMLPAYTLLSLLFFT